MFGVSTRAFGVIVLALSSLMMMRTATATPLQMSQQCRSVALSKSPEQVGAGPKIQHQYMLLIMFKKGTGNGYFGNPMPGEYGCIGDVAPNTFPPVPTSTFIMAANCPNDCVYPRDTRSELNDGPDALGMNPWGIVSGINSEKLGGGPGRRIEVWEMAVRDKCHAEALYAYFTLPGGPLVGALENGDFLGEIVVGYAKDKLVPVKSMKCYTK